MLAGRYFKWYRPELPCIEARVVGLVPYQGSRRSRARSAFRDDNKQGGCDMISGLWSAQEENELVNRWRAGEATAAIGKAMKKSTNAIIGKAHRLSARGLIEGRPNPIKAVGDKAAVKPVEKRRKAIAGPTLPPIAATVARPAAVPIPVPRPPKQRAKTPNPPVAVPVAFLPPNIVFKPRALTACCWPIGEPGTKAFRFCDDVALSGRSYCARHHERAYVRRAQPEVAA